MRVFQQLAASTDITTVNIDLPRARITVGPAERELMDLNCMNGFEKSTVRKRDFVRSIARLTHKFKQFGAKR